MCGLAGFACASGGADADVAFARTVFTELMRSMGSRGRHATGVATHNGTTDIFKVAEPVDRVIKSPHWDDSVLVKIDASTLAVQGHTRNATQNNATRDDCAHPFMQGKVTGAHNGIIQNWRELETDMRKDGRVQNHEVPWRVDSQAIFALLDAHKEPLEALVQLDGYFAISWWKKGRLFLARTGSGVLATAFVPALRTLFWASTPAALTETLRSSGMLPGDYQLEKEIDANTVYEINPRQITEHLAVTKHVAASEWGGKARNVSRARAESMTGSTADLSRTSFSVSSAAMAPYRDTTDYSDTYRTRRSRAAKPSAAQITLKGVQTTLDAHDERLRRAERMLDRFRTREQKLVARLDEQDRLIEAMRAWLVETMGLPMRDPAQLSLIESEKVSPLICHACGGGGSPRNPLLVDRIMDNDDTTYIHEGCILR